MQTTWVSPRDAAGSLNFTPRVRIMKKIATLLLPCLLMLACPSPVKADNGLAMAYLFGYGGYGGYGGGRGVGMTSYNSNIPYFAMHPPVYYGERYARPYGASPFAAWPQLQANSAYAPRPQAAHAQVIANPYCETCVSGVSGVSKTSEQVITQAAPVQAVEIDNPYYQAEPRYTSVD